MKHYFTALLSVCLSSFFFTVVSAQSPFKKIINVTVKDAASGKPLHEAEVTYKGYVPVTLNKKPVDVNLTIQVLDEQSNRPIENATISLKTHSGRILSSGVTTNAKGEKLIILKNTEVENETLRVIATATGYEERWADVPHAMLGTTEQNMFTIFLKKKGAPKVAEEKKYGPFVVKPFEITPTGITVNKGAMIIGRGSGTVVLKHPSDPFETTLSEFAVRAKIGSQVLRIMSTEQTAIDPLKRKAPETGPIELICYFSDDPKYKGWKAEGSFTVYLTITDIDANETKQTTQDQKLKKAKVDLEFINLLLTARQIPNKDPEQIAQEVKRIALEYNIAEEMSKDPFSKSRLDLNKCVQSVKKFHEYFYNRMGQPTLEEAKAYNDCIPYISYYLERKIKNNRL